jgi:hypothetical protein
MAAFVPVSVEVARELKDWCEMPLDAMLDALCTRTEGQVVLPNGHLWPGGDEARVRRRMKLEVSADTLPAKTTDDGETIEPAVPLWVADGRRLLNWKARDQIRSARSFCDAHAVSERSDVILSFLKCGMRHQDSATRGRYCSASTTCEGSISSCRLCQDSHS